MEGFLIELVICLSIIDFTNSSSRCRGFFHKQEIPAIRISDEEIVVSCYDNSMTDSLFMQNRRIKFE